MEHLTQFTFNDESVALLLNCVQFAFVSMGKHPHWQGEAQLKALMAATEAIMSFQEEEWADILAKLLKAQEDFSSGKIYQIPGLGEDKPSEDRPTNRLKRLGF